MLAPWSAIRVVTSETASALSGAPRTTTAARPCRERALTPVPSTTVSVEAEAVGGDRGGVAQLLDVRAGAQQDRERQVAVDDDLLDVEDLARRPRTGLRAAFRSHRAGRLPSR